MAALTIPSDFRAQEGKSVTASTFSPPICHEVMGPDAMIFIFLNAEFQTSFFTLLFYLHQEALNESKRGE